VVCELLGSGRGLNENLRLHCLQKGVLSLKKASVSIHKARVSLPNQASLRLTTS